MLKRQQRFKNVLFDEGVIRESLKLFREKISPEEWEKLTGQLIIDRIDEKMSVETIEEFGGFSGFKAPVYWFDRYHGDKEFRIYKWHYYFEVSVGLPSFTDVDQVLVPFNREYERCRLTVDQIIAASVRVFIGHGRSPAWRDLKDHLHEKHGVEVVAYETGARAGYQIQEVLEEMTSGSSMAFLVLTGEDIDREGLAHARENVIHETGLCQGKLGFKKSIVLLEEGCSEFTNIAGLQQIRFSKGNVKEVFGEVLAVIRREFGKNTESR